MSSTSLVDYKDARSNHVKLDIVILNKDIELEIEEISCLSVDYSNTFLNFDIQKILTYRHSKKIWDFQKIFFYSADSLPSVII